MDKINPDKIESIDVLKNKASIEKYGEKGKDGVVLITLKNDNPNFQTIKVQTNSPLKFGNSDGSLSQPLIVKDGVIVKGMNTNNIPELIKEYGGKISFMGGIHSGLVDYPGWTKEAVTEKVENACKANGTKYFIPCQTSGLPIESFEGVNATINEVIDRMSKEVF